MMTNIFRIKELLKRKRLTQMDLAEQIGLTQTSVTRIVNGEQQPKANTLLSIASALDVDIRDLFHPTKDEDITDPITALKEIKKIANGAELGD